MRKLFGTLIGALAMALLAGSLFLFLRGYMPPAQAPAAQPATLLAAPTPTPCAPVPFKPDAPPAEYKLPPDAPKLLPELLTPRPMLPPECADQLRPGPTPTPTPPGWKPEPAPFELTPSPVPTPRPQDPLGPVKTAAMVNPRPDYVDPRSPTLAMDAEAIFIGTLFQTLPSRWGTRDGRKPATWGEFDQLRSKNPNLHIYTPVILQVEESLKNSLVGEKVTLIAPGGKVDEVQFGWPDLQSLHSGNRLLIFTSSLPADYLGRVGLLDAISQPRRTLIAVFQITGDGSVPFSGPGIQPQSVRVKDVADAIKAAVR